MKNNIIKIAALSILTLGVFTSCERELDQSSFSQAPLDQAMKDPKNFTQAIDGAYSAIKGVSTANNPSGSALPGSGLGYFNNDTGNQIIIPDLTTDNLIVNPQGRQSNFTAYNWTFSANNASVTGLFTQGYAVIARANMPLSYLDNLPAGAFKNNIEAHARAIRAAVHFDLVRAYCKIPTQSSDANTSLGISYMKTFNPKDPGTPRDLTVAQVYDNIIADLNFALANITDEPTNKSRFNKASINGLLSRIYLYKGDYNNAVAAGNASIALSSNVGTIAKFANIWKSNESEGVLFKILNSPQENVTVGVAYQQGYNPQADGSVGQIKSEYVVPKSLYDLYTTTDVRKSAYMVRAPFQTTQRNHVIKWGNSAGTGTPLNVVEVKYLRTAEVYLNVAEAAYKLGNETLANTLLNTLKTQRYTGYAPITLTGAALWNEIMLQRRLEMAFENDRFYTFKRQGLAMQRTGEGPNIDGTGSASLVQTIQPTDTRWQWPIPQTAINITPSLQQNPGY